MMPVKQLGSLSGELEAVEINDNYISFGALLRHLKKLPGGQILWRRSWVLTDDHWADFQYKGHVFKIDSPFVDFWITKPPECPSETFAEVVEHLRSYRPWWLNRLAAEVSERRRVSPARRRVPPGDDANKGRGPTTG